MGFGGEARGEAFDLMGGSEMGKLNQERRLLRPEALSAQGLKVIGQGLDDLSETIAGRFKAVADLAANSLASVSVNAARAATELGRVPPAERIRKRPNTRNSI